METTGTETEREQERLNAYSKAFVPGAKMADGTPILDSGGYFTVKAWKAAIADYKGQREDFIKKYGHLLFSDKIGDYGLTTVEQKLVTGI